MSQRAICPNKNVFRELLEGRLMWFVANVLAVSSRHQGRRTKMLDGHSLSCCSEGNLVDLEWRSADCGAPRRRRPVHIARQDTAVQGRVNTWTPADSAWTRCAVGCRASAAPRQTTRRLISKSTYMLSEWFRDKNSSGDEIANVNFLTTISHIRRPTSKYRKRENLLRLTN